MQLAHNGFGKLNRIMAVRNIGVKGIVDVVISMEGGVDGDVVTPSHRAVNQFMSMCLR